jgi:hypothetical protein
MNKIPYSTTLNEFVSCNRSHIFLRIKIEALFTWRFLLPETSRQDSINALFPNQKPNFHRIATFFRFDLESKFWFAKRAANSHILCCLPWSSGF